MTTQLMATTSLNTTCYADTVNAQFYKSQSHYVSLMDRFTANYQTDAVKRQLLSDSILNFKTNHPTVSSWKDLTFCKAVTTTFDKIDIDVTLQRNLDFMHAIRILDQFKQILVMPICVYEDPIRPGKYICWDGQHTSIVLLIIAHNILGEDISKCEIPIVVYASHQKSEMRECFITLNGEGKQPLDEIDKFHQKVFGVRTDGSTNPDWVLNEKKQQALESAKMFATHEKFGDTYKPGAMTRLVELTNPKKFDLSITENFCRYFVSVCGSSRPTQPSECVIMYNFFAACQKAKITVDDAYIAGVANSIKKAFGGDMNAEAIKRQAKASYQNWWMNDRPGADGTLKGGIRYKLNEMELHFTINQIAKNFTGQLPHLADPMWTIPASDLF